LAGKAKRELSNMSFFGRLLRGNAHAVNFLLFGTAIVAPVMYYANKSGPTAEHVEAAINEVYGDKVAKNKVTTEKINAFWKGKRNAAEMDEVYNNLLRSGKSKVTRHYELTGDLAAAEAKQNPDFAHTQALLAVPDKVPANASPPATPAASSAQAGSPPPKLSEKAAAVKA
jgi:hypothetical protein